MSMGEGDIRSLKGSFGSHGVLQGVSSVREVLRIS